MKLEIGLLFSQIIIFTIFISLTDSHSLLLFMIRSLTESVQALCQKAILLIFLSTRTYFVMLFEAGVPSACFHTISRIVLLKSWNKDICSRTNECLLLERSAESDGHWPDRLKVQERSKERTSLRSNGTKTEPEDFHTLILRFSKVNLSVTATKRKISERYGGNCNG